MPRRGFVQKNVAGARGLECSLQWRHHSHSPLFNNLLQADKKLSLSSFSSKFRFMLSSQFA